MQCSSEHQPQQSTKAFCEKSQHANKMSLCCVKVEESALQKQAVLYGAREFLLVNVNLNAQHQFPFPSDYKFTACFLPKKFEKLADRIATFKVRSDDIWIVTFPKAGTTWIVNIIWQLKNNLNFSADYLYANYMYFESCVLVDVNDENKSSEIYKSFVECNDRNFEVIETEASPRIIKSHLPSHLLPKDVWTVMPKLIYLYRNAKDVAISMYHMFRNSEFLDFQGSLEDFFEVFLNDHVVYGPFFAHVNGFRKLHNFEHILFLSYDEMKEDSFAGVKRISEFLGYTYTDDQLQQLTQHVSFENMRKSSLKEKITIFRNDYK